MANETRTNKTSFKIGKNRLSDIISGVKANDSILRSNNLKATDHQTMAYFFESKIFAKMLTAITTVNFDSYFKSWHNKSQYEKHKSMTTS